MRGIGWGFSAHAKDIWTIPEWEKREKIAECHFGVTCTGTGAEHLQALDAHGGKVNLVYHGLDLSRFPSPPETRPRGGAFTLLSVGRLVAKKGYDDLLDAFSRLPGDLDWRFIHIGGGELKTEIEAQAARLGLADRIEWLGKRDQTEVIAQMRQADLFVLPSKIADDGDRDGLPNVLMEAASQKLPILTTNVSAIPEFITDGEHGTLTPPGAPEALSGAISRLAADPEARATMAEAAYERLTTAFGMEAGIALIDSRLHEAMDEAPAPLDTGAHARAEA